MAADFLSWTKALAERITNSLDRRIPAVLCRNGIELDRKGLYDPIAEAYYTAAIWNIMAPHVGERRVHPAVYRHKCAYCLGLGEALLLRISNCSTTQSPS